MNKDLYTVIYLKNAAFNWINFKLHKFLDKSLRKYKVNKETIFNDFKKFKKELWKIFEVINEKKSSETMTLCIKDK